MPFTSYSIGGGPKITVPGSQQPTQQTASGQAAGQIPAATPTVPAPTASFSGGTKPANQYNLPDDIVQGMSQNQQFGGVLQQFEDARNQTNQANEQRYQDILGGYGGIEQGYAQRTQDLLGQMGNFGQAQTQALQQKFQQQGASLTQDMMNRGLYNSTALDSARQGLSRQQQQQELQLQDMLMRQKMDYGARLSGEELQSRLPKLGFMENRNDVGPTYQDVAGLASAVGTGRTAVPDYQSALGYSANIGGGAGGQQAPATSQAPNVGASPTYENSMGVPTLTAPNGPRMQLTGPTMQSTQNDQRPAYSPSAGQQQSAQATESVARPSWQGGGGGGGGGGSGSSSGSMMDSDTPSTEMGGSSRTVTNRSPNSAVSTGLGPNPAAAAIEAIRQQGQTGSPAAAQVPGDKNYAGSGVYVPGIPYPVNPSSLTPEMLKKAAAWGGSASSAASLKSALAGLGAGGGQANRLSDMQTIGR